jgi:chromosomal replication initiation ATPase DnaA
VRIPDRAVFQSFLPGRNLQAVEHALRVASGAATGAAWICGPAASGKTHLLALFAVLREIQERDGRLVVAAKAPPALLSWKLPDLGSRFTAAAIFQLRELDEREQREALQLRARLRGFELPDDTSRWLQRRFPRDMRTMYELLDTLDEAALVAQRRLTVPFIRSVLKE